MLNGPNLSSLYDSGVQDLLWKELLKRLKWQMAVQVPPMDLALTRAGKVVAGQEVCRDGEGRGWEKG